MKSLKEIVHPKFKKHAEAARKGSRIRKVGQIIWRVNRALTVAALAEILRPELEQVEAESQVIHIQQPEQPISAAIREPAEATASEKKHRKSKPVKAAKQARPTKKAGRASHQAK